MKRLVLVLLLLTALGGSVMLLTRLGAEASPATFTVDSIGDGGDFSTADGFCDTDDSVGDGPCTLRAAIEQANADAGTDTINFSIAGVGPHTISPGSALPTISDAVIIDGTSEPDFAGSPVIELDGTNAGADVNGLTITAGSSTVKGLVINRFNYNGIELSTNGGNTIEGNYIGTDVTGTADLGNSFNGVWINDAPSNTVGGTAAGARNVISGNNQHGVIIYWSGATGNLVQGNYIGTDVSGTIDLGNTGNGVLIYTAGSNTIGGTTASARNVISGNTKGVYIFGWSATVNQVQGNYIGADVTGTIDLGNSDEGVYISGASGHTGHTIGGTVGGAGNTIAFNGGDGVFVSSGTGNLIDPNSIHSNTGLGIDLGPDGVTPNDTGDGDTGANNLQNFPVLTSAVAGGATTTIEGTLNSTASTEFTIEFFSNAACDPSGNGEGESFVGSTTETTDGGGNVSFSVSFGTAVPVGQFITATATDPSDNTSEFSECIAVAYPPVGGIAELPGVSDSAGRNYVALAGLAAAALVALGAGAWCARRWSSR